MKRRKVLLATATGILTAGCTDSPNNGNKTLVNETLNSNDDETMIRKVSERTTPRNTPTNGNQFLFIEQPSTNKVTVAKTVYVHNGCAQPDVSVTQPTSTANEISVSFESVDNSSPETVCTTAIEPTPFAVDIYFDTLRKGTMITATAATGETTVTYEVTGENTEVVLPQNTK